MRIFSHDPMRHLHWRAFHSRTHVASGSDESLWCVLCVCIWAQRATVDDIDVTSVFHSNVLFQMAVLHVMCCVTVTVVSDTFVLCSLSVTVSVVAQNG